MQNYHAFLYIPGCIRPKCGPNASWKKNRNGRGGKCRCKKKYRGNPKNGCSGKMNAVPPICRLQNFFQSIRGARVWFFFVNSAALRMREYRKTSVHPYFRYKRHLHLNITGALQPQKNRSVMNFSIYFQLGITYPLSLL